MSESTTDEVKSKSQIKREMQALRDLGKKLVELAPAGLDRLELDDTTREAIIAARSMKREALRRQLSHIGGLMRREDAESISQALDRLSRPHRDEVRAEHELARWRDGLIGGDDSVMHDVIQACPDVDRQHLRQLVRNAVRERDQEKPPKSARALYRYLRDLRESQG
jgi:ribosome-associated protein